MNRLEYRRCAAVFALASLSAVAFAQDSLTVRIGQVGPTSGPAAHLGKDNVTGLAYLAADELKVTKVAIVDDRSAYGQGVADAFRKAAQAKGLRVVAEQFTSDKAADFSSLLTAIKATGAEAIFYGGLDAQAGPMLRQMQQLGMSKVRLMGGDGICTTRLAELAGASDALAQVICAEGGVSIEKMPGGPAWKKRYDAAYPSDFQGNAPYGYDAVMALAEAIQKSNSADPKVYAPKLFEIDAQGITGKLAFDASVEMKAPAMSFSHYVAGKKVPLN